jgi:hypothetical protein
VEVLFDRALHLTGVEFPWLVTAQHESADPLHALRTRLSSRPPAMATEAGVALLSSASQLLTTLVGLTLCERLLAPVWSTSPGEPKP